MAINSYSVLAFYGFMPGLYGEAFCGQTFTGAGIGGVGPGFLSAPIILEYPAVLIEELTVPLSFYSISDHAGTVIKFLIDFYIAPDDPAYDPLGTNHIKEYNQYSSPSDATLFDRPGGYSSGQVATFYLPLDSPVLAYERVVFRAQALSTTTSSNYSEWFELTFSDLVPYEPHLIDVDDSGFPMFKWIAATDLPELAHLLNYKLEIYDYGVSAMSMMSAASVFSQMIMTSHLSGLNSMSYQSAFSMLSQMGFLHLLYSSSWIDGQFSNTYWQILSAFSRGSYFARVGVMDVETSAMLWSMLEPFVAAPASKTLIFKPGFNLFSVPVYDLDADTARRLIEVKVGYKYTGSPWVSEVIKWKEEGTVHDKWESVAGSKHIMDRLGGDVYYHLFNDFDIEANEGYFINLDSSEPIAVNFNGSRWP